MTNPDLIDGKTETYKGHTSRRLTARLKCGSFNHHIIMCPGRMKVMRKDTFMVKHCSQIIQCPRRLKQVDFQEDNKKQN